MAPVELTGILDYLLIEPPDCFRWVDGGGAIAWRDGPTIAFRNELATILRRQMNEGLPSLGSLLLLLSACRESWPEIRQCLRNELAAAGGAERLVPRWAADAMTALDRVHDVAPELLRSVGARGELVDYVLNTSRSRRSQSPIDSQIVEFLEELPTGYWVDYPDRAGGDLWREMSYLARQLRRFRPDEFRRRLACGIEQELLPAPVELPLSQRVRALLTALQGDTELGGLARLAQRLLAAVSLPRPLAAPDELPLGGVTDLSNRGALDRLLVTELAHDDLTLAVRVATNEALYLRREQPPISPLLSRLVVLDCGVRMWGTPRLIATALALAFCAASTPSVVVSLYRAQAEKLVGTDLSLSSTLNAHLAALETEADVELALPALARQLSDTATGAEAVIVTSEAARFDAGFLQSLRAAGINQGWLISISRAHRVQFWRIEPHALVAVRDLRIGLDEILAPSATAAPLRQSSFGDLPAYCRLSRPPLRVSHTFSADTAWEVPGGGILALSKDGRLTFRDQANIGPVELARGLPEGRVLWVDQQPGSPHRAVIGRLSRRGMYLVRVWFATGRVDVRPLQIDAFARSAQVEPGGLEIALQGTEIDHSAETVEIAWDDLFPERRNVPLVVVEPHQVSGDGTFIYVHLPGGLCVFDGAGERITTSLVPQNFHTVWGRFFQDGPWGGLYAACCDGTRVVFRGVGGDRTLNPGVLCIVTPSASPEQPVALTATAQLIDLTTLESRPITGTDFQSLPIRSVLAVSRDGDRIAVGMSSGAAATIDVKSATATWNSNAAHDSVEAALLDALKHGTRLPQYHIERIAIRHRNRLCLRSGRAWNTLDFSRGKLVMHQEEVPSLHVPSPPVKRHVFDLEPFAVEDSAGLTLQSVGWPDGSRLWVDHRGLLHLRSSDTGIPELTLTLHEGELAGWTSTGQVFGPRYFLGPAAIPVTGDELSRLINSTLTAFLKRLP